MMDVPDLPRDAVHHGRRDQHLSRSRCQARYRSERHRSVHPGRPRHAAGRDPVGGGDGHVEDPVDHRGGGALQDGRPRADHRRHSRWPARLRQCRSIPEAARIKGIYSRCRRTGARSWWCPISRPATCWRKNLAFIAKADARWDRAGCARPDCSDLARGLGAHAHGLLRGRGAVRPCAAPHQGRIASSLTPDGQHPGRQRRPLECQFQGFATDGKGALERLIKRAIRN